MTSDATARRELTRLPNVGPKVAEMLLRIGVRELDDVRGHTAVELYERLWESDGTRPDPCVEDTFAALVALAAGEPSRPWWEFTPLRKARESA
jgi:hypothetical protein